MWIDRNIKDQLKTDANLIQVLIGPRQCGKSSLLSYLGQDNFADITFDDLQMRNLANQDPALFLEQNGYPLNIDEVQYAPNIFPELKRTVDVIKKRRLFDNKDTEVGTIFRLTGSNQILLDKNVKESLAGRASYYYLNTLTVNEIKKVFPDVSIGQIMFQGGWPELYTNENLQVSKYLNDYIRSYIEKDIVLSAGITKQQEFDTVLQMLASRTGEFINYNNIANQCGVKSATVKEWVSVLTRTALMYLLPPYSNNLNKRLVKTPKVYFLDTGLAVRLQGWSDLQPFLQSPQAGHIFETLVLAEIVKYKNNYNKDWNIYVWRTKEQEEIDFVIEDPRGKVLALDAKMGIHNVMPQKIPVSFQKCFPNVKELVLVSYGGKRQKLNEHNIQVPIAELHDYLKAFSC